MALKNIVLCEPIILTVEIEGGSLHSIQEEKKNLFQDSLIALPQANFNHFVAHRIKRHTWSIPRIHYRY